MYKLAVFLLIAASAVLAMPHAPGHYHDHGHDHGHKHTHAHGHHDQPLMPYQFQFQVKDPYSGVNHERQEYSDGNKAAGSYKVALPNGKTQIVTYQADKHSGFQANVEFVPSQKTQGHYH